MITPCFFPRSPRIHPLLVALLAFGNALMAQTGTPGKAPPVSVTAVWLLPPAQPIDLVAQVGTAEPVRLSPRRGQRSAAITFPAPAPKIILSERLPAAPVPANGTATPPTLRPLDEISWPAQSRRVLLLLVGEGNPAQVRGIALDDDPANFPAETVRVVNYLSEPIYFKLGDKPPTLLAAGLNPPRPYPQKALPGEDRYPLFPVSLGRIINYEDETSPDVFFHMLGQGIGSSRLLLIALPGKDLQAAAQVVALLDIVPPPPTAEGTR
jgi:hypothetical protein